MIDDEEMDIALSDDYCDRHSTNLCSVFVFLLDVKAIQPWQPLDSNLLLGVKECRGPEASIT